MSRKKPCKTTPDYHRQAVAKPPNFSTGQFMRWLDVKYGREEDRRMWLKAHLICGVKTNIVTSVEISDGYAND